MIALAPRFIPETEPHSGRFDVAGAVLATLGMTAIVFGTVNSAEAGWTSPITVATLAAGAILLTLLFLNEARAEQPIMPLRLFRSRERSGAYAARMLYLGAMIGFFYFTTQLLQGVMGFSAFQAGIAFFPMTIVNFAVAMLIPRLTPRFGNSAILSVGIAVTLAGMAWLSLVHPGSTYLTAIALPMILIGAGQGLAFAPLTSAGISGVQAEDAGAASGIGQHCTSTGQCSRTRHPRRSLRGRRILCRRRYNGTHRSRINGSYRRHRPARRLSRHRPRTDRPGYENAKYRKAIRPGERKPRCRTRGPRLN